MGTRADKVFDSAQKLTGNPLGIPGADTNMVTSPTDIGHFSPVTKGALIAGGTLLAGGGGAAAGTGTAGGAAAGTTAGGSLSTLSNLATILTPVTALAASASGLAAAKAAKASTPTLTEPTPMPTAGGPNTIAASRASATEQLRRRGRMSTILTAPESETLG